MNSSLAKTLVFPPKSRKSKARGRKTIVHVNRQHIAMNRKDGGNRPVFTVKDYKSNRKGDSVTMDGPVTFIYQPEKPLPCGAVAWAETYGEVHVK